MLLKDMSVQTGIAKRGPAQDHIQLLLERAEIFLVFAHHKRVMVRVRGWGFEHEFAFGYGFGFG